MSYCRFSSDNWRSDVYVYEDVSGGWTTHVASRKRVLPPIPELPIGMFTFGVKYAKKDLSTSYPSKWHCLAHKAWLWIWSWSHRLHSLTLSLIPLRDIGLFYDGKSFNHPSPGECADWLEHLRRTGYHVPQYALDELRQEQSQMTTGGQ